MRKSSFRRMRVRVDESRQNSFFSKINFLRVTGSQPEYFVVGPDRQKAAVGDGYSLCPRLPRVDRPDVAIVENQFALAPIHGKQRRTTQNSHTVEKLAPRCWHQ